MFAINNKTQVFAAYLPCCFACKKDRALAPKAPKSPSVFASKKSPQEDQTPADYIMNKACLLFVIPLEIFHTQPHKNQRISQYTGHGKGMIHRPG
ncbi:hypothetical protein SAMN05444266_109103 [Chitinophaga jiangningensis]|uniref:Uncharacterized protein n=1 Tax=Chitinophaga jiangningensis TaxID=1419482 RepID=A0A1M7K0S6_9BACT|nr:hypothetical protein SAMN05444266_109103 [Chitinophaga jiangningensis]